jgi:hypothetical protein
MQRIIPSPPGSPLDQLNDLERKIQSGPVWVLVEVQAKLSHGEIQLVATPKSSQEIQNEFACSLKVVKAMFMAMQAHHYHDSEWLLLPHAPCEPRPADTYLCPWPQDESKVAMGSIPVYIKFTIRQPKCVLASFHTSRYL